MSLTSSVFFKYLVKVSFHNMHSTLSRTFIVFGRHLYDSLLVLTTYVHAVVSQCGDYLCLSCMSFNTIYIFQCEMLYFDTIKISTTKTIVANATFGTDIELRRKDSDQILCRFVH